MSQFGYMGVFIGAFAFFCLLILGRQKRVRTGSDFSVAGRSLTATQVSWVIIGTLVGGVSTIGTVQTAYNHGIVAWVFTLGSGISCFILGCFFAAVLRREEVVTVSELLGRYFGQGFQYYSSLFNSCGMFIHIIAQYLAAMAILSSVFHFSQPVSVLVTLLLMGIFVVSGGISGAGMVGKLKFFMLYGIMILSAGLALYRGGGVGNILSSLPGEIDFLNFFPHGVGPTLVDLISMITGVLSTQIYLQAVFSAKTIRQARNGAFLSALVIPPIGILGIVVGLYLRAHYPELEGNSAQALPYFFKIALPPAIAAFCSAVLLLAILGTGAGLVLGVTTNLYMDGIKKLFKAREENALTMVRLCTLAVLLLSGGIVLAGFDTAILQWSYLSMGFRGASVFAGLCIVVFMGRRKFSGLVRTGLYLLPLFYLTWEIMG
ncbi:sodium:solute symporter family protein [Desulfospira joergensenii]|uniref:sodium:solute symporter family protein n=1 Tax=Desulfospira joergensenii TaxID=53329 RepID=UPI0003B77222|nr:sodium:solute symporter family protein [Desulfospira joergensenii]